MLRRSPNILLPRSSAPEHSRYNHETCGDLSRDPAKLDPVRLPGAEQAVVEISKLRDYVLNPAHPRGRHEARVFASALDITQADAELLRQQLLDAVTAEDAVPGETDQYGQRYLIDFEVVRGDRRSIVRSAWIVLKDETFPRLTTCFVLSS
jgi:hypothetical protein